MRVVVSGISGFVGGHLLRELSDHGHEVVGISRGPVAEAVGSLLADHHDHDLSHSWPLVPADAVVHLAGLSAVGPSFAEPQRYLQANSSPVTHLFEGLLAAGESPRVLVISTGAVYAPGVGLAEDAPIAVTSPYVVSKLLVETQCAYYRTRGLDITVVRPFNHFGPGQQRGFLVPDLVAGVLSGALDVGDLDTRRDYTDVRDVARAYRLALEAEQSGPGILNVCSGRSVSGRELLEMVVAASGRAWPEVRVDSGRLRPNDAPEIRGDAGLAERSLAWRPELSLAQTVQDAVASLM